MAFWHEVDEDTGFLPESDPAIARLMKKEAGAAVIQDISLGTYWANTVGKTKYPGNYQLYLNELKENMGGLMRTRMNYRELEEFLTVLGYESGDIRQTFREMTGLDPAKLEFCRQEDVNSTPANIPWYNMAWGWSKSKGAESYFVNPSSQGSETGLYTVYCQKDDMNRCEVASFILPDEAINYLKALVKKVHRYDMPVAEQIQMAMEPMKAEPEKPEYRVMANRLWSLRNSGDLDVPYAEKLVRDAVFSGSLTPDEGQTMLDLYVYAAPPGADKPAAETAETEPATTRQTPEYQQETGDVMRNVEQDTPQDFFRSVLPDRLDTIVPQHLKDIMTYVSHRQKDMTEFDIHLHSLQYMKHETPQALVETSPESGRPSGPPRATVSVVLEIADKTLQDASKFALAVFFVNPDGDIGTSDSLKGEDDIIYGFSEDGLRQYFSRDRMVRGV